MPRSTPRRSKRTMSQPVETTPTSKATKKRRPPSPPSDVDDGTESTVTSPPAPDALVTAPSLQLYMDRLRSATDLSTLYATLKLTKEAIDQYLQVQDLDEMSQAVAPADRDLLDQAGVAVAFLMCRKAIELCTLPKSLGGLAFAQAKADKIVRHVFETMGVASCFEKTTEMDLVKACRNNTTIEHQELRKVLPKLKLIGMESRERIDDIRDALQADEMGDAVVQSYTV